MARKTESVRPEHLAFEKIRQRMRDHFAPLRPRFVAWLREFLRRPPPRNATLLRCRDIRSDDKVSWLFTWHSRIEYRRGSGSFPASPVEEPVLTEDDRRALGLRAEAMIVVLCSGLYDLAADAWEEAGGYRFSVPVEIGAQVLRSPSDRQAWIDRVYSVLQTEASIATEIAPEPAPQPPGGPGEPANLSEIGPQAVAARRAAERFVRDAAFRRYGSNSGLDIPSVLVDVANLPGPARSAIRFYRDWDEYNNWSTALAYRLSTATGSAYLVVVVTDHEGVVEVYSETGELWGAGVYLAGVVVWQDLQTVRQQLVNWNAPRVMFFKTIPLEWIPFDRGCESVGGRFTIYPDVHAPTPQWVLEYAGLDESTPGGRETFDSIASGQARAAEIHARG
jgi:hypothetical protein